MDGSSGAEARSEVRSRSIKLGPPRVLDLTPYFATTELDRLNNNHSNSVAMTDSHKAPLLEKAREVAK
jgi:hypothetical protein